MGWNRMFKAFENDTQSHAIHDLTLENGLDRINIFGNLQVTQDKQGLAAAKALQLALNDIVQQLEQIKDLPDQIQLNELNEIENPFL